MSYVCEQCKKPCQGRPHRIVVATRPAVYPARRYFVRTHDVERRRQVVDRGGVGVEIAKEADWCPACASTIIRVSFIFGPRTLRPDVNETRATA